MHKKRRPITYLDTYCEGGYCYSDYAEWCEEQELTPAPEGSREYWEWIGRVIRNDTDDFFDNLKYSDAGTCPVVITGTLGLWHGHPDIQPELADNLPAAIRRCQGDCDAIQVILQPEGYIEVHGMHHDGTNIFEIRPVTQRGRQLLEDGEYRKFNPKSYHHVKKFQKYLF